MPTIGHLALGLAGARAQSPDGDTPVRAAILYGALAVAPDLDLVPGLFHHWSLVPLGHRGATHSLAAAVVVAGAAAMCSPAGKRLRTGLVALLVVASHGLVDPLNVSSEGTAFFWPFSAARLSWGVHFIPITPVSLELLHPAGLRALFTEALIFSPPFAYGLWPWGRRAAAWARAALPARARDPVAEA